MWQKKETSSGRDQNQDKRKSKEARRTADLLSQESQKDSGTYFDYKSQALAALKTTTECPEVAFRDIALNSSCDWMSKLKEDSAQFLAEQQGIRLKQFYIESLYKQGIETLIDKIYGMMQRHSFEFNQVAVGTDLHVSSTISGEVTEVIRYNRMREVEETQAYFRARFSTKMLSLVLRGRNATIEFYVIATNKVMALSKYENEFPPIATLQIKVTEQGGMMWRMKHGVPAVDSLDELAMWLFTTLITMSKQATKQDLKPQDSADS